LRRAGYGDRLGVKRPWQRNQEQGGQQSGPKSSSFCRPPSPHVGYFFSLEPGGKSLNILSDAFCSFFWFFSGLSDSSSVAVPRNMSAFVFASKMSTTSVPTRYSDVVVVAVPMP